MKLFKRILSLVCILATLVLLVQAPSVSAYQDFRLEINKEYIKTLKYERFEDYEHNYNFYLRQKTAINIDFNSTVLVDFVLYDSYFHRIIDIEDITSFSDTRTLKKGSYTISFERTCNTSYENAASINWPEGCNYSLKVSAKMAKKIKFKNKKVFMKPEKEKTLTVTTVPDFSHYKKLTWSSSNEKVATVNKRGKVTTKAYGKAIITATTADGKKAKCSVIVNGGVIQQVHIGSTINSLPKINDKKQSGWKSKNTSIAVGGSSITGKKSGTTTLYKKIGGVTYTCKVRVVNPYTLLSKGKSKLKKHYLYYPSYFQPQTAWRGYMYTNHAVVVLQYKAKSLYGYMITEYAVFYYEGSKVRYEIWDYMPTRFYFKQQVRL